MIYLNSKGHAAAMFYGTKEKTQWFPEYEIAIGTPCGDMVPSESSANAFIRNHTGGVTVVNADNENAVTVALPPGTYTDMFGDNVVSPAAIVMEPFSGMVYLKQGGEAACDVEAYL